jgi:hypothetical protein
MLPVGISEFILQSSLVISAPAGATNSLIKHGGSALGLHIGSFQVPAEHIAILHV